MVRFKETGVIVLFYQVLQRKTEEAAMATKRLKDLLEGRRSSARETSGKFFFFELVCL